MNYQNTLTDGTINPITEQTTQYLYNFALRQLVDDGYFAEMFTKCISNILIDYGSKNTIQKSSSFLFYGEPRYNIYFKLLFTIDGINNVNFKVVEKYTDVELFKKDCAKDWGTISESDRNKSTGIPKYLN